MCSQGHVKDKEMIPPNTLFFFFFSPVGAVDLKLLFIRMQMSFHDSDLFMFACYPKITATGISQAEATKYQTTLKGSSFDPAHQSLFTGLVEDLFYMWRKSCTGVLWLQRELNEIG